MLILCWLCCESLRHSSKCCLSSFTWGQRCVHAGVELSLRTLRSCDLYFIKYTQGGGSDSSIFGSILLDYFEGNKIKKIHISHSGIQAKNTGQHKKKPLILYLLYIYCIYHITLLRTSNYCIESQSQEMWIKKNLTTKYASWILKIWNLIHRRRTFEVRTLFTCTTMWLWSCWKPIERSIKS